MSRFLPDTWLDAVQLPLAMMQFRGNVYVETIAPDIRPAVFVVLTVLTASAAFVKARSANKRQAASTTPAQTPPANARSAWALIAATLVALSVWIWTSANGRYGLLALTLTPLAALAALRLLSGSKKWLTAVLGVMLGVQVLFLLTADPDDTWSKLTLFRWTQAHADRLPARTVAPWRSLADNQSVLVVTLDNLTGMSALYQVFGPRARYMGLNAIEGNAPASAKAMRLVQAADRVYLSHAVPTHPNLEDTVLRIPNPLTKSRKMRLLRFGLAVQEGVECQLLPDRMGARLQICPLVKTPAALASREDALPQQALQILRALEKKCPRIFGEQAIPISNDDGGVLTSAGDGKYFIEITKDLNIYARHRSKLPMGIRHPILNSLQVRNFDSYSCDAIIVPGRQYW